MRMLAMAAVLGLGCTSEEDQNPATLRQDLGPLTEAQDVAASLLEDAGKRQDAGLSPDLGEQDDMGAEDAGEEDVLDWAAELEGRYDGEEVTESLGTLRARFEVGYDTNTGRFNVRVAGDTRVKFYFTGVDPNPNNPTLGYIKFPLQTYAEGQTGPTMLEAEGTGSISVEGLAGAFDGIVDLEAGSISIDARITVRGSAEPFSVQLQR